MGTEAMLNHYFLLLLLACKIANSEFYAGRTKPRKFEYPELNGRMLVGQAKAKCEQDLACGGFTFKGSYKTVNYAMEMYFFHVISDQNDFKHLYWSTYKVDRKFVRLSKVVLKSPLKYSVSNHNGLLDKENYLEYGELTKSNVVAIQPKLKMTYSKIDFADIAPTNCSEDEIILNLDLIRSMHHTFPKIDKCCKLNGKNIEYDGIDDMERIDCKMPRKEFIERFVNKREAVMMTGCQTHWKARNWTIQNLLDRYHSGIKMNKSITTWRTTFQTVKDGELKNRYLTSNEVKNAINSGYFVKIMDMLKKSSNGWADEEYEIKYLKLDLFDEYSFPMPMPDDEYLSYHVDSDQAYLMLATSGTGSQMHVDPDWTDAFNALIRGEKWWVTLPKDLYEFKDEFLCDPKCSDQRWSLIGPWFTHIMPQIRNQIFYGQKLKSFLQKPGETLYMPNMVLHSVWNVSPTVAIGDNPLYESSFDEWAGSGGAPGSGTNDWVRSRILALSKGKTRKRINDILEQVAEAIIKHNISDYSRPVISAY